MTRIMVDSTNIAAIGYNPTSQTLEVKFKSGSVYQYDGVPESVYDQFMRAPSKGRFFGKEIRNRYQHRKVIA